MTLSRRGFLHIAGVSLAATQLHGFAPLAALAEDAPAKGRVLLPVSVGGRSLWPDSVVTILDADEMRYRLPDGWVPREAVQPMFLEPFIGEWQQQADYAEVTAPVAPVYRVASTDAPIHARVGHGGVLPVLKSLHKDDAQPEWIEVALADTTTGWVQAHRLRPVSVKAWPDDAGDHVTASAHIDTLSVDRTAQRLTAFSAGEPVLTTAVAVGSDARLLPGRFDVEAFWPVTASPASPTERSLSWSLSADVPWKLGGVHWHNAFGAPQPGTAIQLPIPVARWLYRWTARPCAIVVI